jgi:hypothetical protein
VKSPSDALGSILPRPLADSWFAPMDPCGAPTAASGPFGAWKRWLDQSTVGVGPAPHGHLVSPPLIEHNDRISVEAQFGLPKGAAQFDPSGHVGIFQGKQKGIVTNKWSLLMHCAK